MITQYFFTTFGYFFGTMASFILVLKGCGLILSNLLSILLYKTIQPISGYEIVISLSLIIVNGIENANLNSTLPCLLLSEVEKLFSF